MHGYFVGVFDIATGGNARSNPSHLDPQLLESIGEIAGGGFAFDGGVGCENHFVDFALIHATRQI